jgi:hypothetical protein
MEISFHSIGKMKEYFGSEAEVIELNEHATILDMVKFIKLRWNENIPEFMWDNKKNDFRGPVMLIVNGVVQLDRSAPLHQGDVIQISKVMVGG